MINARNKLKVYKGPKIECDIKETYKRNKWLAVKYCEIMIKDEKNEFKKLFENSDTVDLPTLYGAAKAINLDSVLMERVPKDYYKRLSAINVELSNVKHQALTLCKFDIARDVDATASQIQRNIRGITGDETISQIISIGETPFFDFSANLNNQIENAPVHIGDDIDEYIQH